MFYLTMHSTHLITVIWHWTYGKGPFTKAMVCAILSEGWCLKRPLVLIEKGSPCSGGSTFPVLLYESYTICPMPYKRIIKCVECVEQVLVFKI